MSKKEPSFAKDYGVQRYANHDPAPRMPFDNAWEPPSFTRFEKTIYVVAVVLVLIGLTLIAVTQ